MPIPGTEPPRSSFWLLNDITAMNDHIYDLLSHLAIFDRISPFQGGHEKLKQQFAICLVLATVSFSESQVGHTP